MSTTSVPTTGHKSKGRWVWWVAIIGFILVAIIRWATGPSNDDKNPNGAPQTTTTSQNSGIQPPGLRQAVQDNGPMMQPPAVPPPGTDTTSGCKAAMRHAPFRCALKAGITVHIQYGEAGYFCLLSPTDRAAYQQIGYELKDGTTGVVDDDKPAAGLRNSVIVTAAKDMDVSYVLTADRQECLTGTPSTETKSAPPVEQADTAQI